MKKFNLFFLMAFISLSSVFAQAPAWSWGSTLFKGLNSYEGVNHENDSAWHKRVTDMYATRLEYPIHQAPATWDAATSNVADVWDLLPAGTPVNNYFVDAAKKREPSDAADFTGTVKYMYDADNLYVLFKATDDYIFPLDSTKQEQFEVMYAPYADSIKMADLFVLDPAFKDSVLKFKWQVDSRQSFAYWGKAGAYKTSLKANGTGGSYLGLESAYDASGTVNWGAPIAGLGITTKFAKLSATEYTYQVTIPFAEGMKDYVPTAGAKIAIEFKVVDKDTGKPKNIEAASNTNNNDLYIHMPYTGRGVFQAPTGLKNTKATLYSIYPNPTADVININNADALKQVVISDLAGRQVKSFNTVTNSMKLGLSQGSYLIQLIGKDNRSETQKLVIR